MTDGQHSDPSYGTMKLKGYSIIAVVALIIIFVISINVYVYDAEYSKQCKAILTNNSAVQLYFGDIEHIRYSRTDSGRTDTTWTAEGYYSYWIRGSMKNGIVKLDWKAKRGEIIPTKVSTRVGFVGSRVLWPEDEATSPEYILPSHIWDAINSIITSLLCCFFYFNIKKNGMISRLMYSLVLRVIKKSTVQKAFVILAVLSAMGAILEFFEINHLF